MMKGVEAFYHEISMVILIHPVTIAIVIAAIVLR